MDMYESKHDEIEPSSAAGSGACARAAASPPSLPPSPSPPLSPSPPSPPSRSRASALKRTCISFSNSTVFCSACVSTATSSEPRAWSRISSRCLFVIEQKSSVSDRPTCHACGKSVTKVSSNWRRSCRCQPYRSSVLSSEPASPYGWKACLYGANCQLENHATISRRAAGPRASTTAHAPRSVSVCDGCGAPSCAERRLKSSKTWARRVSLSSPTLSRSSSIFRMPAYPSKWARSWVAAWRRLAASAYIRSRVITSSCSVAVTSICSRLSAVIVSVKCRLA
mmetsp:Transcript_5266/g.16957  ORF Transcript_5266/g.16957 Transcript_5266/m.16957 type:complete len:281 (+) Transcript_5266:1338-2180(+)